MPGSNYQYFCGANVVIEVEGVPLYECCGLRINTMESKRPIYGYSSRHFEAVANGQVLVEGALLIDDVDDNYWFRSIEQGLRVTNQLRTDSPPPLADLSSELRDQLADEGNAESLLNQYQLDPLNNPAISEAMKSRIWQPGPVASAQSPQYVPNPHDSFGGLDIRVTMGDREPYNFYRGLTNFVLESVHFIGRGKMIQISADVIVEEYPFFARNRRNQVQPNTLSVTENDAGEVETTISQ